MALEAKIPKAIVLRDIPDWRAKVPNLSVSATKDHLTTLRLLEDCDWSHEGCTLRAGASARNTGLLAVMASTVPNDSEVSATNDMHVIGISLEGCEYVPRQRSPRRTRTRETQACLTCSPPHQGR